MIRKTRSTYAIECRVACVTTHIKHMTCCSEGANLAWIKDYTDVIAVVDAFDLKYDFWMGETAMSTL